MKTLEVQGEWPRCECGKRAVFMLGTRDAKPVCPDGVKVWRDVGDMRPLKRLTFQRQQSLPSEEGQAVA